MALERRGISLRAHALRRDPATGRLPIYHVFLGQQEHWFTTREKLDEFVAAQEQEVGEELDLADEDNGNGDERPSRAASCTSSSCTKSARSTTNWPRCAAWASRSTA